MAADITLNLAKCFQYKNPSNGDDVVKALMQDYVSLIGLKVCDVVTQLNTQQNAITSMAVRVKTLEDIEKNRQPFQLPTIRPTGIGDPNTPISLVDFMSLLETKFLELQAATGNPTEIYNAITTSPITSNAAKALGTSGGNLSSLPGWKPAVTEMADAVINMALMIGDLRSAVRNMQNNCCNNSCNSVEIVLQTTFTVKTLTLFFTGNIPSELVNCESGGSLFKISDQSGNFVNSKVDIVTNINQVGGFSIDLSASPLNFADDLNVTSTYCLNNPDTGTVCTKYIEAFVSNTSACPSVSLSATTTTISYQFTHLIGTLTYYIEVYDGTNTLVATQSKTVSSAQSVSGTFTGLDEGTQYKVRLQMVTSENTKQCPFVTINTLANPCPAPLNVSTSLQY